MLTSPRPSLHVSEVSADDDSTPISLPVVNGPSTIHHELTTASNRDAARRRVLKMDFNAINDSRVKQAEVDREEKERMKEFVRVLESQADADIQGPTQILSL